MKEKLIKIKKINNLKPNLRKNILLEIEEVVTTHNDSIKYSLESVFKLEDKKEIRILINLKKEFSNVLRKLDEHDFLVNVLSHGTRNSIETNIIKANKNIEKRLNKLIKNTTIDNKDKLDMRVLNSRPIDVYKYRTIDSMFKIYLKYFTTEEKILNAQSGKIREEALEMAKFANDIFQSSIQRDFLRYSKGNDSLDQPSSSWSRLSKFSLRFLRKFKKDLLLVKN